MADSTMSRPDIGDIVAIDAVDWGYEDQQLPAISAFTVVRGRIYGKVIACNAEWVTVVFQAFDNGDVRCALSIPWVTVTDLVVLRKIANG